jgi:Tfp pilus assembly protein PilF
MNNGGSAMRTRMAIRELIRLDEYVQKQPADLAKAELAQRQLEIGELARANDKLKDVTDAARQSLKSWPMRRYTGST